MTDKRLPSILRRSIDPNGDINEQADARLKAIFTHCGIPWDCKDAERWVLVALMLERYNTAFEIKPRSGDKRCKVEDVADLKTLVEAIFAGKEGQLADHGLRPLGAVVRKWLNDREMKATKLNICTAISKVDKGKWKGVKPATLLDNVNWPPGSDQRKAYIKSKTRKAERARMLTALARLREQIVTAAKTAPDMDSFEA